ncbi:MAG: LysM peptidoglycan-binding domain-containing protein, partial [Staphylococcus epidermidis]|nr:LysM peptidoglycan-binding domain-containing protein [Staphylococcus epidermidis]
DDSDNSSSNPNATSTNNNDNVANNNSNYTNQNQQDNANQNSNNQQATQGQQSHTVYGQENLYRIAIQYYGEGTQANVDKIKRANGLSSNNIHNGQTLVIPQ